MLDKIDAVIFDLDGTLLDSMWVWTDVDQQYIDKYNLTVPEDFNDNMEGKSFTETAEYFVSVFPALNKTAVEIMQEWREMTLESYQTKVSLKPGAGQFLKYLKDRKILIGIATSNDRYIVEASLAAKGLRSYVDAICTSCEVCIGKPAPDVYLKAASLLNVEPSKCLVFEDVPNGILAGKNAGMRVCAIEDDFSRDQAERKRILADYYIDSYLDIINGTY